MSDMERGLLDYSRGDIVSYQNYVLSRMPEVWGDDASEFKPERWFDEDGQNISYSPFSKFLQEPTAFRGNWGIIETNSLFLLRIPFLECWPTKLSRSASRHI